MVVNQLRMFTNTRVKLLQVIVMKEIPWENVAGLSL
jgi:hypothetical protein